MNNNGPTLRLDEKWLPSTVITLAWPVSLQSAIVSIFALTTILFIGRLRPAVITAVSVGETIVHLPASAEQLATQGAMNMQVVIVSSMGTTIYAGYALAMRVLGVAYVLLSELATTVAILIGQSPGAARPHLARTGGYLGLRYCVAVMACIGLITFALARQLIGMLASAPEVVRIRRSPPSDTGCGHAGVATSLTLASGLRGAGDTRGCSFSLPWVCGQCAWVLAL